MPIITKFFNLLQVQVPAKLGGFLDGVGHFCRGNLEFCMSLLSMMRLFLIPYQSLLVFPKYYC